MPQIIHAYINYGYATSIAFTAVATADTDQFVSGASGPVTADVSISKDGAALGALSGTTISNPGAGKLFLLNISADDSKFTKIDFLVTDGGADYQDVLIKVETRLPTQIFADASQIPGSNFGIYGLGSATGGGTNVLRTTTLGAEPTTAFDVETATVAEGIQHLGMRAYHKRAASGTLLVVYKKDDATALNSMTISVAGGTVTVSRAS